MSWRKKTWVLPKSTSLIPLIIIQLLAENRYKELRRRRKLGSPNFQERSLRNPNPSPMCWAPSNRRVIPKLEPSAHVGVTRSSFSVKRSMISPPLLQATLRTYLFHLLNKVILNSSDFDNDFSFIAADDCEKINVPLALLPSQGEDMSIVSWYSSCGEQLIGGNAQINKIYEGVEKKNPGKNMLKHFSDQPHGWTAARGDVSSLLPAESKWQRFTKLPRLVKGSKGCWGLPWGLYWFLQLL